MSHVTDVFNVWSFASVPAQAKFDARRGTITPQRDWMLQLRLYFRRVVPNGAAWKAVLEVVD